MNYKKVLFLSNAHCNSIYRVGSHHLSEEFKYLDWDVEYISAPLSFFKLFDIFNIDSRKRAFTAIFNKSKLENCKVPFCIIPYYRSKFLKYKKLRLALSKAIGVNLSLDDYDLILIDSPEFLPEIQNDTNAKIIYRPTDIYKYQSTELFNLEKKYIFNNKKISIICMSNTSFTFYSKYSNNVMGHVSNGVATNFYKNCIKQQSDKSQVGIIPKNFVYVGAIDDRLDLEWLECLAAISGVVLHIYGDGNKKSELLRSPKLSKAYCGVCKYDELPKILHNYDVGLLPFSNNKKNKSRSPMKLFEYISAGLLVISNRSFGEVLNATSTIEAVKLKGINNNIEIADYFNIDLAKYSRQEVSKEAKPFLWSNITKTILKMIYDK